MDTLERERRRLTFDEDAARYDRARPSYPEAVFADLEVLAGLKPGSRICEVGCGTGKATRALAERGYHIAGLELGKHMATLARHNLADFEFVRILDADFENWTGASFQFDCIVAASAWHWIDPEIAYVQAARLLKPGGTLALIGGGQAYPLGFDPFFTALQTSYAAIGEPAPAWPPPPPEAISDKFEHLAASPYFENAQTRRYLWTIDYTAAEYIDVLNTFSAHRLRTLENQTLLTDAISQLGAARSPDRITKHILTMLQVAQVRPGALP